MIDVDEIATGIYRLAMHDEADLSDMSPPGVTTCMYVIQATQPAILQTEARRAFARVKQKVGTIVDPASLRYIVVPHHEADSSGALNEWLAAAPSAAALCSEMCAFLSLNDFSDKRPRVVKDGEVVDLGSHRLRFLITPMVNQWDSLMAYEETTGTLFSQDLFSNAGLEKTLDRDMSNEYVVSTRMVGYQADDKVALGRALDKIQRLKLQRIAPMHGPILTAHFERYVKAFREQPLSADSERSVLLGPPR